MIRINYWTNWQFEETVWDKYYCKNFASAKRKLKLILDTDKSLEWLKNFKKDIIKQYDSWYFDKKTCSSVWKLNYIKLYPLYIFIEEIY